RGLGSAVVDGFKIARGKVLGVMDADLQHPPEKILELLSAVENGADIAIASRYVEGGEIENWGLRRKIISKGATTLVHMLIPAFKQIKDPLSGFFLVRRKVVENINLNPQGFKILLEILTKGNYSTVVEVPYRFKGRELGESKLNFKEYIKYLHQLWNTLANILSPLDIKKSLFITLFFSMLLGSYLGLMSYMIVRSICDLTVMLIAIVLTNGMISLISSSILEKKIGPSIDRDIQGSISISFLNYMCLSIILLLFSLAILIPFLRVLIAISTGIFLYSLLEGVFATIISLKYASNLIFTSRKFVVTSFERLMKSTYPLAYSRQWRAQTIFEAPILVNLLLLRKASMKF
ncbi:MAG: glycosyltransferase, partial [Candidatus Baldrarchaeia archaeon]